MRQQEFFGSRSRAADVENKLLVIVSGIKSVAEPRSRRFTEEKRWQAQRRDFAVLDWHPTTVLIGGLASKYVKAAA